MYRLYLSLAVITLFLYSPPVRAGKQKVNWWKTGEFVGSSQLQLPTATRGARTSRFFIQLEITQNGVWLTESVDLKGKIKRRFLFALRNGKVVPKKKKGQSQQGLLIPVLYRALRKAKVSLLNLLKNDRFGFVRIFGDSSFPSTRKTIGIVLDRRHRFELMARLLYTTARVGFSKLLFAVCHKQKQNPCLLRYLPVDVYTLKDMKELKKLSHLKRLAVSLSPQTLRLSFASKTLTPQCKSPEKKHPGHSNFWIAGGRDYKSLEQCLRKLHKSYPSKKLLYLAPAPSTSWSTIAKTMDAVRFPGRLVSRPYSSIVFTHH